MHDLAQVGNPLTSVVRDAGLSDGAHSRVLQKKPGLPEEKSMARAWYDQHQREIACVFRNQLAGVDVAEAPIAADQRWRLRGKKLKRRENETHYFGLAIFGGFAFFAFPFGSHISPFQVSSSVIIEVRSFFSRFSSGPILT